MNYREIGVLLTSHKRPHTLAPQLAAINAQTLKPHDVVIFHDHGGVQPDQEAIRGQKVIASNWNMGVWARLSAALYILPYQFIVILDDDTIPGPRWLERCMNEYDRKPALFGVNGVTFENGERNRRSYCGLQQGQLPRTQVDIVGHGWFMCRAILQQACLNESLIALHGITTAGEDYHLAWASQDVGLPVCVPGFDDDSQRGSTRPALGTDTSALYLQPGEEEKKAKAHWFYKELGWKTLHDRRLAHEIRA